MKPILPLLALLLFLSVVCLSTMEVGPLHADCEFEENFFDITSENVETDPFGAFSYELVIRKWELELEPAFQIIAEVDDNGHYNVDYENVDVTPSSINVVTACSYEFEGEEGEWDHWFQIDGNLDDRCEGNSNLNMEILFYTDPSFNEEKASEATAIPNPSCCPNSCP